MLQTEVLGLELARRWIPTVLMGTLVGCTAYPVLRAVHLH